MIDTLEEMSDAENEFIPPRFPLIPDQALLINKDFSWNYTDRRAVQEIVPGIFIGPMSAARDVAILQKFSIQTLVAVRTISTQNLFKQHHPSLFRYVMLDLVEGSLLASLPRVKPIVEAALSRGERILFYDETGNAKAPIVVCSYLMDSAGMSANDAIRLVKTKRLSVALNEHERYQLEEFQTILEARSNIVAHSYSQEELNRGSRRRKCSDEALNGDSSRVNTLFTSAFR